MHAELTTLLRDKEHLYPVHLAQRFPRIIENIVRMWGSALLDDYFHELFLDHRGNRQGFDPDVMADIFVLYQLHEEWKNAGLNLNPDAWAAEKWVRDEKLVLTQEAFFVAVEQGNEKAVKRYIDAGVDLQATNSEGWTPLMVAASTGSEPKAALLIAAGARVDCRDRRGYGPLHCAAMRGHAAVVALLLRKGAAADAKSDSGITPLLQAATCGHATVVRLLLTNGAWPSEPDNEGWTPLHKAVANGYVEIVRLLVGAGANKRAQHASGETPESIARRRKQRLILDLVAA